MTPTDKLKGNAMFKSVISLLFSVILSVLSVGCGSNLSSGVTLADAKATCLEWDRSHDAEANFETLILLAEIVRDEGGRQSTFVTAYFRACEEQHSGPGCFGCVTQIGAAVWR